ncbi:MAG: hypothetical protein V1681_11890 [Candidatus Neomarinimicrobiota bacterium]
MSADRHSIIMTSLMFLITGLFLLLSNCTQDPIKSEETLTDTTSHNFTWEIDTLGLYGSYLNDVLIVDENNILVTGYIKTDSGTFNAGRWTNSKWILFRVLSGYSPNYGILYFSESDIWITSGLPQHWNGTEWILYHLWDMNVLDADDGGVEHIWASSPEDIYFVGRKGTIVHYDGSTFLKMESGTDTPIIDICGTDANHIWATAISNQLDDEHPNGFESVTLFCDGQQWIRKYESLAGHTTERSTTELKGYMASVWTYNDTVYISSNSGLWKESIKKGKGILEHGPDKRLNGSPFLVRGTGYNDVYAFTHWGEFLHYNGKTWNRNLSLDGINVMGASVTEDMVVTVGDMAFRYIVIVRGRHL